MRLLFLTWDGPGTTYHETLFVPLLARARRSYDRIALLQLTWGATQRSARISRLAKEHDLSFQAWEVPRGVGKLFAPLVLVRTSLWMARGVGRGRFDTIMARSTLPAAVTLLAALLSRRRFSFIFDADGLEADEKVEFGSWRQGGVAYRCFTIVERAAVRRSDIVLVRTARAAQILAARADVPLDRFLVVSNGKDESQYVPVARAERDRIRAAMEIPAGAPLVAYVGSIGPQYRLEQMVETFDAVRRRSPDARLLLLTPRQHHEQVRAACAELPGGSVTIKEALPAEVPSYLGVADLGLAYRSSTLSQQAVAPIKVGEYLLCGVPVVYTEGVGDLDRLARQRSVLSVANAGDPERVARWFVDEVLPHRNQVREEARMLGVAEFSIRRGASDYRRAFDLVGKSEQHRRPPTISETA
jgi:glycosyltransferase involved in cell wall biosynthesis